MAEPIILGIVGIKNMGNYDANTNYEKLNIVTYQGSTYCALTNTIGHAPTDTDYWQLYAEKGSTGPEGPQGPKPVKGVDYYTAADKIEIEEDLVDDIHSAVSESVGSLTSATPLVASSTAGMVDTTRIYVNTNDGHWYWYDGANWQDGGVYQSTGIGRNTIDFDLLNNSLQNSISRVPEYTTVNGYYIGLQKNANRNDDYFYTSPIFLKKNEIITFTNYTTQQMASLISCDSENSYVTRIIEVVVENSGYNTIKFKAPYDMYVSITSKIGELSELRIYNDNSIINENINNYIDTNYNLIKIPEYTLTTGYYVRKSNLSKATLAIYCYSSPIKLLKNEKIKFIIYSANVVSILSESDKDGNLTENLISLEEEGCQEFTYIAPKDMYVVISGITTTIRNIRIVKDINKDIEDLSKVRSYEPSILSMFSNITCIGDSLTWSQVYISATSPTSRQAYVTYPDELQKITGTPTSMLATKGYDATQIWDAWGSSIVPKTNQLTILYAGTNYGLTDTIDTDVIGDDYTQYANTNTGNYAKIIKKSLDVGSKVILVKIYANTSHKATTNSVIEKMATRFNIPFVENDALTDNVYHTYPDGTGSNNLHYNDLGYHAFTKQLINNINYLSDEMKAKIIPS